MATGVVATPTEAMEEPTSTATPVPPPTATGSPTPTASSTPPTAMPMPTEVPEWIARGLRHHILRVRYGLHPDRARIVLDLEAVPEAATESPKYTLVTEDDQLVVNFAIMGRSADLSPEDKVVRRIQLVAPAGENAVLRITLKTEVTVNHFFLTDPPRVVFDLYPKPKEGEQ